MNKILFALTLLLFEPFAYGEGLSPFCGRIVSISPSVTELLFSVGLGSHVVGVSRYDTYPEEVKKLPSVGGLLDPNLETAVSLRPTLVAGLVEQKDVLEKFQSLGIKTVTLEHRSLSGVLHSFSEIQSFCSSNIAEASSSEKHVKSTLEDLKTRAHDFPQSRVVVVVYREYDAASLKDVYLSGTDGYYSDVLGYVGGRNIFNSPTGSLSAASIEGLIQLDPDAIFEVLPPGFIREKGEERLMKPWKDATLLRAVRNNKVFLLDEDWATIPGPRVTLLAQKLLSLLHGGKS